MKENDNDNEEKREGQEIIGFIDFELDEDGLPVRIIGGSYKPQRIFYSLLIWVARLQISLVRFSSSSDNNSRRISTLTKVLIFLGAIQLLVIAIQLLVIALTAFGILGGS